MTLPIAFSDLLTMDTHLDSAHAAEIYMYIFSQNHIESPSQSDAELIQEARAACRTVVTRCLCREVGFHSMSNFKSRLHEIFDEQFVVEDDQVFSKMFNAFHRDVLRCETPNAFRSHQSARRRPAKPRRLPRLRGMSDVLPAASGHVSGRDEREVQSSINNRSAANELAANAAVWLISPALEKFKRRHPRVPPALINSETYLDVNDLSSDTPSVCASCPDDLPAYLVCVGGAPTSHVMIAFDSV